MKYSHVHDALQYVCLWHKGDTGYTKERLAEVDAIVAQYNMTRMVM